MEKKMFLEVLELMKTAVEGKKEVDLLVRVGETKLMRLHGLNDGHPIDEPETVWIVFTGIPGRQPDIAFDSVLDLCKAGAENTGWLPHHEQP